MWRRQDTGVEEFLKEAEAAGAEWPLLKAGFFSSSLSRFREVRDQVL